jgi:hypothetical protein
MTNHRRLPDPPYTPPNAAENDLGYWFVCAGCDRVWSQRYIDQRTKRCLSCARIWRRDDMANRRRGGQGVPLVKNPPEHPFESRVLRREVNLNSPEAQKLIGSNELFRAEVDAYVGKLIAKNGTPKPSLHGVAPLLARPRTRVKAERVEVEEERPEPVSREGVKMVDGHVDGVMNVIEGEIVNEKPRRRR